MISRRQIISRSAKPIFAKFSPNESILGVDNRSGPLFDISRDVAMATDFVSYKYYKGFTQQKCPSGSLKVIGNHAIR